MPTNNVLNNRSSTFTVDNTLTVTDGDINLTGTTTGNLDLPATNSAGTRGVVTVGALRMFSFFGDRSSYFGFDAGNTASITTAADNIGVGYRALQAVTSASRNVALGSNAAYQLTTPNNGVYIGYNAGQGIIAAGGENVAVGYLALSQQNLAGDNVAIGAQSLRDASQPVRCTAVGPGSLAFMANGTDNIAIGWESGQAYTGAESSNILIDHDGVLGESNVIRIGSNQTACYIDGISGVNVGSVATVLTMASDQVGTAVITAGTGIDVLAGANTITISSSGGETLDYTNVNTTPYTVLTTDQYISVDCSGGAITVNLPLVLVVGKTFTIKDRTGNANTFNITVTTVGGGINIDGAATYTMNTQYASINIIANASTYEIW